MTLASPRLGFLGGTLDAQPAAASATGRRASGGKKLPKGQKGAKRGRMTEQAEDEQLLQLAKHGVSSVQFRTVQNGSFSMV
jgi:hypothetical protein